MADENGGAVTPPGVPPLDQLAGAWMPAGTLFNMPSVNNFHGGLHAGWNLLSFLELNDVERIRITTRRQRLITC